MEYTKGEINKHSQKEQWSRVEANQPGNEELVQCVLFVAELQC